jgi:uncharacterized protein YyaL (SSP411 family)
MSELAPIRRANRLAGEKSPYLRQHAYNLVDWLPWGEEAFARAAAEQKPIFLSIGYSTCHWCHVMAHESFENDAIALALNSDFVSVKVDREERPDVDRIYMSYLQAATGQGGWPMSVWLTPGLKPFYGGTYFPPEDLRERPGFATVLAVLAQGWAEQREQLLAEGDRVAEALRRHSWSERNEGSQLRAQVAETGDADLLAAAGVACEECFGQLTGSFDAIWGGFGCAPKFPRASVFHFLFRAATGFGRRGESAGMGHAERQAQTGGAAGTLFGAEASARAIEMAVETLRKMAEGGIHDHVGGGFHRYSVDARWFVPHFEKMLYDQAQLAVSYLEAWQATGEERLALAARGVCDYVLRDLAHPAGGFYSAEDADSEIPETGEGKGDGGQRSHAEGAFYLWTKEEIDHALDEVALPQTSAADATIADFPKDGAEVFCAHFDVQAGGNVPGASDPHGDFRGKNILRQRQSLAQTAQQFGLDLATTSGRLQAGLARLRALRAMRPRPALDDKVITAWNGLMISALAKGHRVFAAKRAREAAANVPGSPPHSADVLRLPAVEPCVALQSGETRGALSLANEREDYLAGAVRAAGFIRRELYDEPAGMLYRSYCHGRGNVPAFAEDYACLIQGLLDLYETSFDIGCLQWASRLQDRMDEMFWDADNGGYFNTREEDRSIIARMKENYDGAEPAANSVAALNLWRLEAMIGRNAETPPSGPGYATRASACVAAFRGQWEAAPNSLPQMLCAMEFMQRPLRTIVLAGDPKADDFRALAAVAHERSGPPLAILAADQGDGQAWLAGRKPYLAEMKPISDRAAAYVCENFTCRAPATAAEELRLILRG